MRKFFCLISLLSFHILAQAEEFDIRIPVLDMREFFLEDKREQFLDTLYHAMTEVGFFAVSNTGVDAEVVKTAYAEAERFFRQERQEKMECYHPETHGQRGFVPGETGKGHLVKDVKEFYHVGRNGLEPPNVWPEGFQFKDSLQTLYKELDGYVEPLQRAVIAAINHKAGSFLDENLLNDMTREGQSLLRAIYYPALSEEEMSSAKEPIYWATPHTDIDLLAILPFATARGLQVERDGKWLNVVAPEDAFIVNVGDMLQNLTNGLFVSGKHRVLAQEPDQDRFSMVLFVHPRDESLLDPLPNCIELTGGVQKFAPGTRLEFLWERLLELGIAPFLLETYAKTGHVQRQMQYGRASPQVVELLIKEGFLVF